MYVFHIIPYNHPVLFHNIYKHILDPEGYSQHRILASNETIVVRQDSNVVSIFICLDEFVGRYNMIRNNKLLEVIFGEIGDKEKNNKLLWQNSLFIFYKYMWSSIVLNFKLNGIDISGGSISKRHVLKTVQYELIERMRLMYGFEEFQHIIHSNLTDPFLSSTIPLKEYKK